MAEDDTPKDQEDRNRPDNRPETEDPASEEPFACEQPLYADPFAGTGPCSLALAVEPSIREAVTQCCPRCGQVRDPSLPPSQAACILEGVELDDKMIGTSDGALIFLRQTGRDSTR